MRTFLAALVLLFLLPTQAYGELLRTSLAQIVKDDRWSISEGIHGGKPLVIRFRDGFGSKPDVGAYPTLLRVTWTFNGGASGMPDQAASKQMEVFENRLVKVVEPDNAVLVAVVSNNGAREWAFYTSDAAEFGRLLTEMPQEKERYPIEISAESDPAWSFLYDDILAGTSSEA